MKRKSIKVSLGKTGFHYVQIKLRRQETPTVRLLNFDMRPNTGKKPFTYMVADVAAFADAQRNPYIAFGARTAINS